MPTHHIASWLVKHSDIPLTVVKPVATKLGISTNYLGAALFAGQIVYENQGTIVKYANTGGVAVGGFLHDRAAEKYGEEHALTEYLGENVAALNEAFEGTEEEAITFAEFYRQFRTVERDTPDVAEEIEMPDAPEVGLPDATPPDAHLPDSAPDFALPKASDLADAGPELGISEAVREAVPDRPGSGSEDDSEPDPEDAVQIPVSESG
ncbi:hypothetical protein [Halorussus ruber]|uniref:hypothetical protein n=1 Tax=Halorussus ruber TaxID=1126238 RepID=UPI001091ADB8|nr:hypothetical protein [Halorussus ruber]